VLSSGIQLSPAERDSIVRILKGLHQEREEREEQAALDEQDRKNMEKNAPRTLKKIDNGEQLSIYDIKQMTNAGISDKVIISQIQATGSQFNLTSADIIDLKNAGVAQNVIDAMIQAGY